MFIVAQAARMQDGSACVCRSNKETAETRKRYGLNDPTTAPYAARIYRVESRAASPRIGSSPCSGEKAPHQPPGVARRHPLKISV